MLATIHILTNPQVPITPQVNDLAFLSGSNTYYCLSSSGSSSERVKWIVLSQEALWEAAQAFNSYFQIGCEQIWANILPSYHISGLMPKIRAHLGGYQLLAWSKPWSPSLIYQFLIEQKVTGVSVVPTQLYDWVQLKLQAPPQLKHLVIGGAPLSESLFDQAQRLGWPVSLSYGMTESSALFAIKQDYKQPFQVLPHVNFKVGNHGQLAIKSASLFSGSLEFNSIKGEWSWQDTDLDESGYWLTADQVSEVDKQHFSLKGRMDEFIKVKGEGVYLNDVRRLWEDYSKGVVWHQSPLLLGCEQGRTGYELVLVVDPRDANLVIPLQKQWNLNQPSYLTLRIITLEVKLWPRSALGKIQWVALKKLIC